MAYEDAVQLPNGAWFDITAFRLRVIALNSTVPPVPADGRIKLASGQTHDVELMVARLSLSDGMPTLATPDSLHGIRLPNGNVYDALDLNRRLIAKDGGPTCFLTRIPATLTKPADNVKLVMTPGGFVAGNDPGVIGVVPLPTLPDIVSGYAAVFGVSRLRPLYAGPAMRVQRASDGTQADIGFAATGLIDMAAAASFGGGSELRVVTFYDQSGNGKHALGSASNPSVLPILTAMRSAYGSAWPAMPEILHQGLIYPYPAAQVAGLALPASLSLDQQNLAFFDVMAPNTSLRLETQSQIGAYSGSGRVNLVKQPGQGGLGTFLYTAAGGGPTTQSIGGAGAPRVNMQVAGIISRPSGRKIFCEDVSANVAAAESFTITGGSMGGGAGTTNTAYFTGDRCAFVVTTGAITDAEASLVQATLSTIYGTAKRADRLILLGSSGPEGRGANNAVAGTYSTQSTIRMAMGRLDRQIDAYNAAISGRTAEAARDGAPTEVDPLLLVGVNNMLWPDVGGNSLAAGTSGAATYAVYKDLIAKRRAALPAGATLKLGVNTQAQRTDLTSTPAKEVERHIFNNLIRAGRADLGYDVLADYDAIPGLQNPGASNPFLVTDQDGNYVHCNNAGQLLRADLFAPAIQAMVSGTVVVAPGQPTSLTLGTASQTMQALTWSAPSGGGPVLAYVVEFKKTSDTAWTTFSTASNIGTSITVSGLTANTSYDYRVTPTGMGGGGTASATVTGSTLSSGTAPTAPAIGDTIQLNFFDSRAGGSSVPANLAGWNDVDQSTATSAAPKALVNSAGVATPLTCYLATGMTSGNAQNTAATAADAFPKAILDTFLFLDKGGTLGAGTSSQGKVAVLGAVPGTVWELKLTGYRINVTNRQETFSGVGTATQTVNAEVGSASNGAVSATFSLTVPASGELDGLFAQVSAENLAYLNGAKLKRTA